MVETQMSICPMNQCIYSLSNIFTSCHLFLPSQFISKEQDNHIVGETILTTAVITWWLWDNNMRALLFCGSHLIDISQGIKPTNEFVLMGWGLLSQFPPLRFFPNLSGSWKHRLAIEYHVYVWQVSPQFSCGNTCQIWMWFKESSRYFCKIETFCLRQN